jgi:hypothetical protein
MTTLTTVAALIQEVIGEDWDLDDEITLVGWLSGKELDEIIALKVGDVVEFIDACRT